MKNHKQFKWLVGIAEGEGYFSYDQHHGITFGVEMSDEDTIKRIAKMLGSEYHLRPPRKAHHVVIYSTRIYGTTAVKLGMDVLPYMSARRKEQIRKVIDGYWKRLWTNHGNKQNGTQPSSLEDEDSGPMRERALIAKAMHSSRKLRTSSRSASSNLPISVSV